MLLVLIPVVGLLYPLFRLLPAAWGWGMQHRIYRLYGELKVLEMEFDAESGDPPHALDERLRLLERPRGSNAGADQVCAPALQLEDAHPTGARARPRRRDRTNYAVVSFDVNSS